ncbi:hypothetical protein [Parablautia sp. Marseille-Q6255]|uniref:hypothetical protein n=1 Tax=Parablautia sp. Marseille-Q6255 TaxID=3039593 RepID=UPI0024BCAF30|nr:hypothetical protein [Parablautia sp. Marseille-Q6255]
MDEKFLQEMSPYRLNQLMKIASKVTDLMVSNVWHLTFNEMTVVLDVVRHGIECSKEDKNVFE